MLQDLNKELLILQPALVVSLDTLKVLRKIQIGIIKYQELYIRIIRV